MVVLIVLCLGVKNLFLVAPVPDRCLLVHFYKLNQIQINRKGDRTTLYTTNQGGKIKPDIGRYSTDLLSIDTKVITCHNETQFVPKACPCTCLDLFLVLKLLKHTLIVPEHDIACYHYTPRYVAHECYVFMCALKIRTCCKYMAALRHAFIVHIMKAK